jgi:CRP-like cAMP-binding protein
MVYFCWVRGRVGPPTSPAKGPSVAVMPSLSSPRLREVFARCELWSNAPEDIIDGLFRSSTVERFRAGATVLSRTSSGCFLVVLQGRVRMSASGPRGHEFSFTSALPGETLGIVQAIQNKAFGMSFIATENSSVATVPIDALNRAIAVFPGIAYQIALLISQRFESLFDLLTMLDSDVHQRLAVFILQRRAETPAEQTEIDLGMSRRELASRLGTVPETLSRAFAKLRDAGLITTNGRRLVTIVNEDGLEELAP